MPDENAGYPKTGSGQPLALEARGEVEDGRRFSPSIARNRDVVRETYLEHMPTQGTVLEIASGTGEHGAHIAAGHHDLTWIYSDIDQVSLTSQAAWASAIGEGARLEGPLILDVTHADWASAGVPDTVEGVFCANMIHIAPFSASEGLFAGVGRHLSPQGRFMLYGPFARDGMITPSNARFSEDLQRRDPLWGVRDLDQDLVPLASAAGLHVVSVIDMPANNLSVIFEKA